MALRIRRRKESGGFTLGELMVAVISFAVIATVVLSVSMTMYRAFAILTAKGVVTDTLRNVLEQMGRDVQKSRNAVASCGAYVAGGTTLILSHTDTESIVYRCVNGSCTLINPGELERRAMVAVAGVCNGATATVRPMTRKPAVEVTNLAFTITPAAPPNGRVVQVAFEVRRRERGFEARESITDYFRWRGH